MVWAKKEQRRDQWPAKEDYDALKKELEEKERALADLSVELAKMPFFSECLWREQSDSLFRVTFGISLLNRLRVERGRSLTDFISVSPS